MMREKKKKEYKKSGSGWIFASAEKHAYSLLFHFLSVYLDNDYLIVSAKSCFVI